MNQTYLKEFHAQRINPRSDCIDFNDLAYISERTSKEIIGWEPVGIAKNKPHFNATLFHLRGGEKTTVFHVKPIYYVNSFGLVRPIGEILSHHGNRYMQLKEGWENSADFGYIAWLVKRQALLKQGLMLPYSRVPLLLNTVTTVYPDPDPETTTVDGRVTRSGVDQTFTNIRSGAGVVAASATTPQAFAELVSSGTTDQYSDMTRGVFLFDTSSIPDTDAISEATISFYITGKTDNFSQSLTIVTCSPASNTDLVTGDYAIANWTMTQQNTTDTGLGSLVNNQYNDLTFNATGRASISKTGVSKFGAVLSGDRTNTAPTWIAATAADANARMAEFADTTSDPKLAVTHAVAATTGGANSALLMITGA